MTLTSPASNDQNELVNIINRCDFLQLTTSQQAFSGSKGSGLPVIKLTTAKCDALIAVQGAHLLTFKTRSGEPLLWVSPNCNFTQGVALRGGVPVCLPWFGPNVDPAKPKHGFARNRDWQLTNAVLSENDDAMLTFNFTSAAHDLFEFTFSAQLIMTLGDKIKLEIKVSNLDENSFDCSWVLHSYHPVSSLENVQVKGLSSRTYLDNLENHAPKIQQGDVEFSGEVDRVFPGIENSLEIIGTPNIEIKHHNCPSVVVWNPGAANAAKMSDVGAGNEQGYICVERGAVLDEKWSIAAGESKTAWVEINEK